jgi:hypothetical protein
MANNPDAFMLLVGDLISFGSNLLVFSVSFASSHILLVNPSGSRGIREQRVIMGGKQTSKVAIREGTKSEGSFFIESESGQSW